MLQRPKEHRVSSWLYLKQNTDRLQRKQPALLAPAEKADAKKSKHHKSRAGINGGY